MVEGVYLTMRRWRVLLAVLAVIGLAWVTAQWRGRATWSPPPVPTEPGLLAP